MAGSVADYTINLDGEHAANHLRSAYIAGGEEHTKVALRVNHNVPDCTSDSLVKGVAGGKSTGEFYGLVYVAQDAQRTDARQTVLLVQSEEEGIGFSCKCGAVFAAQFDEFPLGVFECCGLLGRASHHGCCCNHCQ